MLRVETLDEAEVAQRAGVGLLPVPPAMILDGRFYPDLAAEHGRLQAKRAAAMTALADEVHQGLNPAPQHLVDSDAEVVGTFRDWLDREG